MVLVWIKINSGQLWPWLRCIQICYDYWASFNFYNTRSYLCKYCIRRRYIFKISLYVFKELHLTFQMTPSLSSYGRNWTVSLIRLRALKFVYLRHSRTYFQTFTKWTRRTKLESKCTVSFFLLCFFSLLHLNVQNLPLWHLLLIIIHSSLAITNLLQWSREVRSSEVLRTLVNLRSRFWEKKFYFDSVSITCLHYHWIAHYLRMSHRSKKTIDFS